MKLKLAVISAATGALSLTAPLALATAYSDAVLSNNPLVYYQFEEVGGTTAVDASGNANHGTYVGAISHGATPSFSSQLGNTGVLTGGYVDVPALGTYAQSSVEAWVNLTTPAGGCCTSVYSTDAFGPGNFHFNIRDNRSLEHAIGASNANNTANGVIQDGDWYHIVSTYDTTATPTTRFYVNGAEIGTATHIGGPPSAALIDAQVGAWGGGRNLSGRIDQFAIYDSVLTPAQVYQNFSAAADPPLVIANTYEAEVLADNPLVYYRFEESAGPTAMDSSGNGNHGTYQGAPSLLNISATPEIGSAVGFNNGADSVAVPALGSHTAISIEAWLKPDSTNTFDTLYNTDAYPGGAVHFQFLTDGTLQFTVNNGGVNNVFFGTFSDDVWLHTVTTYDSATNEVEMFVNGVSLGTQLLAGNQVPMLAAAHIGAWDGSSRSFDGLIDEFAIYGEVLSPERIQAHFDARLGVNAIPEPASASLAVIGVISLIRRPRGRKA